MKGIMKAIFALCAAALMLTAAGCVKHGEQGPAAPTELPTEAVGSPAPVTEAAETSESPSAAPETPTEAPAVPTEAPVSPTEAPAPTEAPVSPTEAPAPTETPKSCFIQFSDDEPIRTDMDGDGRDDTVLITTRIDASDCFVRSVKIITAAHPDEPFRYETDPGWWLSAAIVDCDPADGCRELILSFDRGDRDYVTLAFRSNGGGFDVFSADMLFGDDNTFYYGFPDGTEFDPAVGLPCERRGDDGSYFPGHFTVTADGFVFMDE